MPGEADVVDNGEANEAKADEADVANKPGEADVADKPADATEDWAGKADAANKASGAGKAN
jgi:hypothetical protein